MNQDEKKVVLATSLAVAASVTARAVGELAGGDMMGNTIGGEPASRKMVESLALGRIVKTVKTS